MNLANKKVRKIMKNLKEGERICLPWAIIEAGGLEGRPQADAYVGWYGKVFYMNPTDAGLVVERKPDDWDKMVKMMAGF